MGTPRHRTSVVRLVAASAAAVAVALSAPALATPPSALDGQLAQIASLQGDPHAFWLKARFIHSLASERLVTPG